MKYIGVKFTSYEKPFETHGQTYYYKTNLEFEKNVAYDIVSNGYRYGNPVIVVEVSKKAPDPSRCEEGISADRAYGGGQSGKRREYQSGV